ncbi:PREDICTED: probable glycerol-3-phosphate acyltransferase 3 isoform X2 [Camelina sativa]|uniref:Probable glycerol-3-phosphate acyltransferase 3 isoform X1 n=1 Tax=Camelina sativa TaxID=90675 RepID=A0ABM1QT61_CAMSA|nr:PREDICTED: probable glycerol-3-phosphate acyltransferase 3 isoform X1 [Camelina sativa]XP_010456102.1 PREDICTED: probable glycerol-3-phosphate acyltransferase 3 isoform X3 [Camelina sativa]XP_010456103.1 PREDICTED: probable glycerol-3-phosphate acyltransferase 3 isoform X4 [Camelina sativa]XP_019089949.1 PREDICTED: probable glycerol-3-phosphate acyltransferase 3 isoform X2 [Camelina sativa]
MSAKIPIFQSLVFLFYRFILRRYRNPKPKYQNGPSSLLQSDLSRHTLIFNVEGALLKSNTLFPYFMLVAFEAGGVIRSFILFILYPFISLMSHEMGVKVMVMVSFFGIKKEGFRAGRAVLPKHFLEDVGLEMFEVLKRGGKRIGVSNDLPQVMIEGFLRDYLEIDVVVGREMKVVGGYYLGIMEDKTKHDLVFDELVRKERLNTGRVIGITSFNTSLHRYLFSQFCQEIYFVKRSDKRSWQTLPRSQYPKPLIFHDGRLAIKPTLMNTLVLFMWGPFAAAAAAARLFVSLCIPYSFSIPILCFSGCRLTVANDYISSQKPNSSQGKGRLFVCNHRTLLDPLYVAFALKEKNIKTVTYSLSRVSEILAPIKTVRLNRDRVSDGQAMETLLTEGDLVVCPEGTTCREPYMLRFSPLFTEVSDVIVPVAVTVHVTFFYGTTASGFKAFDPLFFLMDPYPTYNVEFLDPVSSATCQDPDGKSKFEVANHVQSEIGKALDFECTKLTRKDKYLILAGNNGVVKKN